MATEEGMEARIARPESDVEHIRSDMADVKVELRTLRDKMDGMSTSLTQRMVDLTDRIDAVNTSLKDGLASAQVWALVLYIVLAGGMLGTMARGFGWL